MREVTRDEHFPNDSKEELPEAELVESGPSETELVTVALLMRLYDINMEILRHFNPDRADEVYELHENGGTANPPIFIPEVADGPDSPRG